VSTLNEPDDTGNERPEPLTLNSTAWAAFLSAIENPPKANPKLKKLLRDYKPAE
jgi:uncharacterized protein (DUF1778 family)